MSVEPNTAKIKLTFCDGSSAEFWRSCHIPGDAVEAKQLTESDNSNWLFYDNTGAVANNGRYWTDDAMFDSLEVAIQELPVEPIMTVDEWHVVNAGAPDPNPDNFELRADFTNAYCHAVACELRLQEADAADRFIVLDPYGALRLADNENDVCIYQTLEEECPGDSNLPLELAHPVLQFLDWVHAKKNLALRYESGATDAVAMELLAEHAGYSAEKLREEKRRIDNWRAVHPDQPG